jgi:hypothetical protein
MHALRVTLRRLATSFEASHPDYVTWREASRSFDDVAGYVSSSGGHLARIIHEPPCCKRRSHAISGGPRSSLPQRTASTPRSFLAPGRPS